MPQLGAYNYLAKGMSGAGVSEMQNDLMSLGFTVTPDGSYGNETYKAVKDFQYTWGSLSIDGVVGSQTAAAIKEAVNMLMRGQWDPAQDPMQAPSQIQATNVPQPPRIEATTVTTPGAATPTLTTSDIPIVGSLLPNVDLKWIGIGVLAVVGFFYYMRRRG